MESNMSTQEFEMIYQQYKNLLYRIAFTYLKNNADVEDILQEVFLKRVYQAPVFDNSEYEKRWMIRITVNMCKNVLKNFWNQNMDSLDENMDLLFQQWDMDSNEKTIMDEVFRLPEKQRIVIYLYYFEGYACKEIANILKISESAVKMRLKKGRTQLKAVLVEE